jgi:hypothetical protein
MNRPCVSAALLVIGILFTARLAAAQEQEKDCGAPTELVQDDPKLPLLAARLKQHKPVKIVAIGGSSTAGAAAQSPLQSYPERLEETLAERYPGVEITVVNKGVPRQTAQEMVDRFAKDVVAEDRNHRCGARHRCRFLHRNARGRHRRATRTRYRGHAR